MFEQTCPDVPHPPKPVKTRWGTWLQAISYYSANLQSVAQVLDRLDPGDAESIPAAKMAVASPQAVAQIGFIRTNYSGLCDAIKELEKRGSDIRTAIGIFDDALNAGTSICNAKTSGIVVKVAEVRLKNAGLAQMRSVARLIFDGEPMDRTDETLKRYSPEELACLKFCPLTSCDAERSFSMLKDVFRDNRASFTERQLSMHMVVHCNANVFSART